MTNKKNNGQELLRIVSIIVWLSAGTDNELEIVFMLQPRSDGKTTIKGDGYLVGAKMDYV